VCTIPWLAPVLENLLPQHLSLQQYLLRGVAIVLVVGLHGWLLTLTATLLGDKGVRQDERLTINPLTDLDLIGAIAGLLYLMGWMRPMRIDYDQLKGGRIGLVLCVLLACAGTCTIALLVQQLKLLLAIWVPGNAGLTGQALVTMMGRMGLWFGLANLLPLTPFTGGHLLGAIAPAASKWLNRHLLYPTIVVALLIMSGAVTALFRPLYDVLARFGVGL
jgi:Zn-dependent protease